MGLLRSSPMQRGTLVLARETARDVMNLLGHHANIQFDDTFANDITAQRTYRTHVQRIEECERILRFLFEEVEKHTLEGVAKNQVARFLEIERDEYRLEDVERHLKSLYKNFTQFRDNNSALLTSYNETIEAKYVAEFGLNVIYSSDMAEFVGVSEIGATTDENLTLLANKETTPTAAGGAVSSFNQVAGTVPMADQARFARFLFRSTCGNSFTHFHEIPETLIDPVTQKPVRKSAFVVYFQGMRTGFSAMGEKIQRACTQFGANLYPWLTSRREAEESLHSLTLQAEEKARALRAYESFVQSEQKLLVGLAPGGNSLLEEWRLFTVKEKSIYHGLNKFQSHTTTLRCTVWFPEDEEMAIRELLLRSTEYCDDSEPGLNQQDLAEEAQNTKNMANRGIGMMSYGSNNMLIVDHATLDTDSRAPTFFRTNDLTFPFQKMVFTYGVPRYQEASPVLFTIVTFPFIFGIMFGDVGHGSLLFITGLWACWSADTLKQDNPTLYMARYMLAMMGFFAVFAGFLYSDLFSVGLDLFGSRWICEEPKTQVAGTTFECTAAYDIHNGASGSDDDEQGPYPFGLDPAWHGATNELLFVNSFKMKFSVIIGVAQMLVGLMLRFSNAIFERNGTDLIFECIPMAIFMVSFFGFMDYLIFYKWVTPLDTPPYDRPPSIINSLIALAMFQHDPDPMWAGYDAHAKTLLFTTMGTVPFILLPKPLILWWKDKMHKHVPLVDDDSGHVEESKFDMGDVAIHQIIETIEYVLGTVSHTASYLRLWALSLAHQQLSAVFFEYTLGGALHGSFPFNVIPIYINFAFWFLVTMGILMGMDTLECFLHALRLHWVEFQSKFFRADGYEFAPFRHTTTLEPEEA